MFLFINRNKELDMLEQKFKLPEPQFIVIYGRRRTGKTELIKQFCKDKEYIYFLADKRGTVLNVGRFASIATDHFNDAALKIEDFYLLFDYINRRLDNEKKTVIIIDEFSYLVEKDDSIASVFQGIWDEVLAKKNVFLILCGSSISMMELGVLSYKSPLYGRRTGQWKLSPFSFKEMKEFFPDFSLAERVEIYSVLGGIPFYLKRFRKKNIFVNIEENILTKGEPLYEEVEFLLREELREYSSYYSILEAIAAGSTRIIEIADHSRIKAGDLPKYMDTLIKLDIVEKVHPVTEKEKTKKTIYKIKDNFFNFWFKFVYPHKNDIEIGNTQKVIDIIKQELSSYTGHIFEDIVKEFLILMNAGNSLPFNFSKIGTWWSGDREIDVVALSKNEALFVECKWQNRKTGIDVLKNLTENAQFVNWQREKDHFAVFSRSGFTLKAEKFAKEKGILLFTVDEMKAMFG
ncbi:MAG: ATP-binding protein [Euryarchaeota archaeon]|nr:ATP-binding protein [Euryarchaeota archaeon]